MACRFRKCEGKVFFKRDDVTGFLLDREAVKKYKHLNRYVPNIKDPNDYILDENGFRQDESLLDLSKKIVNVYGDSFTFGVFLKEKDTFVHQLNQSSPYCTFLNYAVPGFDIYQMLKLAKSHYIKQESFLDLYFMIENDITRMIRKDIAPPGARNHNIWSIQTFFLEEKVTFLPPIPDFFIENSYIGQRYHGIASKSYYEDSNLPNKIAKSFVKKLNQNNKRYELFFIPSFHDIYVSEKKEKIDITPDFLRRYAVNFPYDPLSPDFKKLFLKDGHPNALGSSFIAKSVKERLKGICF